MSDVETPKPTVFAFIVDGEVAWLHGFDYRAEQAIAAMQSNPIVVEVPQEDVDRMVDPVNGPHYIGWTYADGVYTPPV
jgi:hypothetical protein